MKSSIATWVITLMGFASVLTLFYRSVDWTAWLVCFIGIQVVAGKFILDADAQEEPQKPVEPTKDVAAQPVVEHTSREDQAVAADDKRAGCLPGCFDGLSHLLKPQAVQHSKGDTRSHLQVAHTAFSMEAAGVPAESAEGVANLTKKLCIVGSEPLSDPLTVLRFYSAREKDLEAAALMYRETVAWRSSFRIGAAMMKHGAGEQYDADGSRASSNPAQWEWHRNTTTRSAQLVQQYGFWGRLTEPEPTDGAPVAVWRLGSCDVAGYIRENIVDEIIEGFAAHLEDLLQASRAISRQHGRLIRCRMILDAQGLSTAFVRNRASRNTMRNIIGLGKAYYPEVNASVTIVRAPKIFSTIYEFAKPKLTPVMRRKVCILGDDFEAGLREHAGIELAALPEFLGGRTSNDQIGLAGCVPQGLQKST